MMANEYNPIRYANELESTGVPKEQAAVHANALTSVLADVAFARDLVKLEGNLRREIRECEERMILRIDLVRTDLSARIDAVRTMLDAKIDLVRTELGARMTKFAAELRTEMAELRVEIAELRVEIAELRASIVSVRHELVLHRWVLGLVAAIGTANLALTIKLILP